MRRTGGLICVMLLAALLTSARAAEDRPIFEVPRVEKITVDGRLGDWGEGGFRVRIMTTPDGRILPVKDLDASFRLGWDARGLLVAVTVVDDAFTEGPDGSLWAGDGVELFLADKLGGRQRFQMIVAPGLADGRPRLRKQINDQRERKQPETIDAEAARTRTKRGYALEALLPWKSIGLSPKAGREAAFQLYANDADGGGREAQLSWYPAAKAHEDSTLLHRIRLSAKPSEPVLARAGGRYDRQRMTVRIGIAAAGVSAGRAVEVFAGGKKLAAGKLLAEGPGRAAARLTLPLPPPGRPYGPLTVRLAGRDVETLELPSPDRWRAEALRDESPHARGEVFVGTSLPPIRFERPLWMERLIGPYELKTTYYDGAYNVVTEARAPGRYAAVVEIVLKDGRAYKRFKTLYRQPKEVNWWLYRMKAKVSLPAELGVRPEALAAHPAAVGHFVKGWLTDSLQRSGGAAVLLAGLHETEPTGRKDDFFTDPTQRDRQWWVGLKRKLYGWDKRFAKPFVCPRPIEGTPAPVVRTGSAAEAGMKADAAMKIDAVLQQWAADTDEAFAVCVVRHGVIVLHEAYGLRDGEPMTLTTKSWMASTSKMLSGSLMMMLVDQGLISLDDEAAKFLPPLRGVKANRPLTIRHLYTHTNGMEGHWGDGVNDMAERMAPLLPHLAVGRRYDYNGTGMELACKILEAVSGRSLPSFHREHLLGPLGCRHTDVGSASWDARSTPLDMARIGQMLLNRGAYGKVRFFREKTFEQMLPRRLTKVLGPDTKVVYGIGTSFFSDKGLGKGTFAHGAASAATTRIDPVNDLVIVMTRNTAGRNFRKYHQRFIDAVVEGIADPAKQ